MYTQVSRSVNLVILMLCAPLVFAATAKSEVSMSKALMNLQSQGFSIVRKIELEHNEYVAKVINAEGKEMKIRINSQTGELTKPKSRQERLSALDIAKKVEEAGYKNIYKIDTEWFRDEYEVKAKDSNGKDLELSVDAKTGKITKQ